MESPAQVKQALQDQHVRMLKESSPAQKSQIILQNSGFAAAIHKNRHLVSIQFGQVTRLKNQ